MDPGIYFVNRVIWMSGRFVNAEFQVVLTPGVPHILRSYLEGSGSFWKRAGKEPGLMWKITTSFGFGGVWDRQRLDLLQTVCKWLEPARGHKLEEMLKSYDMTYFLLFEKLNLRMYFILKGCDRVASQDDYCSFWCPQSHEPCGKCLLVLVTTFVDILHVYHRPNAVIAYPILISWNLKEYKWDHHFLLCQWHPYTIFPRKNFHCVI